MTDPTPSHLEVSTHLPLQACPVRRDDQGLADAAAACSAGVEPAGCGNLTGMARDLCYAEQYGVYF